MAIHGQDGDDLHSALLEREQEAQGHAPTADDSLEKPDTYIDRIEAHALEKRRIAWGQATGGPTIGLALSGGGIRSATFSLGVLRELSALGILTRFDYLSTASGGTYVGAFFGGLFVPRSGPDGSTKPAVLTAQAPAPGKDSDPLGGEDARKAIGLLRQSGRYLAPSGPADYWFAITILIRNWIGLHLLIGSTVFGVALIGVWARAFLAHCKLPIPFLLGLSGVIGTAALALTGLCVAFGWSYWLTRRDVGGGRQNGFAAIVASVVLVAACLLLPIDAVAIARSVAAIGGLAIIIWIICLLRTSRVKGWPGFGSAPSSELEQAWDAQRLWITKVQAALLQLTFLLAAFAVADALAFWIAHRIPGGADSVLLGGAPLGALALVRGARTLLSRVEAAKAAAVGWFGKAALNVAITVAAALLVTLTVGFWTVLAYRTTWPFKSGAADPLRAVATAWPLIVATIVVLIIALGLRGTVSFLNLSSLATFYAGRLRRAYLGAGNRTRFDSDIGIENGDAGDDIQLIDYYDGAPPGAPLHLIGVTLNQTRGRGSNLVQRDRHGRNLTLGPAGITYTCDEGDRRAVIGYGDAQREERLPLSAWIGISGASFSTGMGARTGFGFTTLAGLANVRLGYWWRAGLNQADHSVQAYILNEIRGRFAGTGDRRWYLSDGGHFDNTAIYELIRRKLPFILASDNGQDERYAYEDLANLVRKARIDFGAEITFLNAEELDSTIGRFTAMRRAFGTLGQIGGCEPPAPGAVAALAMIKYNDDQQGTLVLIKPRLTGDGPADLIRYKSNNAQFPQQTTLDQFFDEAQWESYFALGRLIARLIMKPRDGLWIPANLSPLPRADT
jgi:hypothetical protein